MQTVGLYTKTGLQSPSQANKMLPPSWQSNNLRYTRFSPEEASQAKAVFDANQDLREKDPTFSVYPINEFIQLIGRDRTDTPDDSPLFYLRRIETLGGVLAGYIQVEIDAPQAGSCWLPMLVLRPEYQSIGYGRETVQSLISELRTIDHLESIGLNVYAENPVALRFWFQNGFTDIIGVDLETAHGRDYTCITLTRRINA